MKKIPLLLAACVLAACSACSTTRPVKTQAYAQLTDHRTFEYEFPVVWKGIEAAVRGYKVVDRDPDEVGDVEMRKLTRRKLETDWIYGKSRDKYVEYAVNGSPRKQYLQTRIKYTVLAQSRIGGTDVSVDSHEEIEKLKEDGTPAGYDGVSAPDSSRANELIENINHSILSAAP